MPTAQQLARQRAHIEKLLKDRATIYEEPLASAARDASGGIDRTFPTAWRVLGSSIPCQLSSALRQGTEATQGGKPVSEKQEVIYFAHGQAVSSTCRIVITSMKRYKPGDDPDDDADWANPVFDVVFPHTRTDELVKKVEVKERI